MFFLPFFILGISSCALSASNLPHRLTFNNFGSISCSATVMSKDSVLVPGNCASVVVYTEMNIKIRDDNTTLNDSGEIYGIRRIILTPRVFDENWMGIGAKIDYILFKLDRSITIDGAKYNPMAAEPAAGTVCTTLKRNNENRNPDLAPYWTELIYHFVEIVSKEDCQAHNPSTDLTDIICVVGLDLMDPSSPMTECRPENGAPLVCNGNIVGISSCDRTCSGVLSQPCYFKKISSIGDFIFQ